jgi:hypothetical protein
LTLIFPNQNVARTLLPAALARCPEPALTLSKGLALFEPWDRAAAASSALTIEKWSLTRLHQPLINT